MPLRETYKDKTFPAQSRLNTPKTRVTLFLVTVILLVCYSLVKIDFSQKSTHVSENRVPPTTRMTTTPTYHDSDVDYSKHLNYAKLGDERTVKSKKGGNNGFDPEKIDRSLDGRVVGSITKDKKSAEKSLEQQRELDSQVVIGIKKETVQADVTKAQRETKTAEKAVMTLEKGKKASTNTVDEAHDSRHKVDHLKDHLKQPAATHESAKTKVLVEQFENGGVRVLDRINMS